MISAEEALRRLKDGNQRFVAGALGHRLLKTRVRRKELAAGQEPFAVILGCSDSRVPVEMIFDEGLGDLFVVRVAGNIVARSQLASVEFGVSVLGARLVVVLGHSGCGAVKATLDHLDREPPEALRPIVERIRPAVASAGSVEEAVRANVRHAAAELRQAIAGDGVTIAGAEYSLETGKVDFIPVEI